MVTIYTLTYNEELMIEFFINHYRKRFPSCDIVIFDNGSTDKTVEIAQKHNCKIEYYDTKDKMSDRALLEIKNHCWKKASTDWVLVCDCDELAAINENHLKNEEKSGHSIIEFKGYDLVNTHDDIELSKIKTGVRNDRYNKNILFNRKKISDINYAPGCHTCKAEGEVFFSKKKYRLLHYRYLSEEFLINRYRLYKNRFCQRDLSLGKGVQYQKSEEEIKEIFKKVKNKCKVIR